MGQEDGEKWTAAVDLQPTLPKPGVFGNLGHSLRARDIPKYLGNAGRIVRSFFEPGVQIGGHFRRCTKVARQHR